MAPGARGFLALDDLLLGASCRGGYQVRLDEALLGPVCAHIERRFRARPASDGGLVLIPTPPGGSLWREAGVRLGLGVLPSNAEEAAARLSASLERQGGWVVGRLGPGSAWDASVTELLGRSLGASRALVLLLAAPGDTGGHLGGEAFSLEEGLGEEELARWWAALSAEGLRRSKSSPGGAALGQLERGWGKLVGQSDTIRGALLEGATAAQLGGMSRAERALFERLGAAGRSWPLARLGALAAEPGAAQGLVERGVAGLCGGPSIFLLDTPGEATRADDQRLVARALLDVYGGDPWACGRAAVLLARAGELVEAEAAHERAIRRAEDVQARADLWSQWGSVVRGLPEAGGCYLRGAELALARSDADGAHSWAERAVALCPDSFRALMVLGRASLGRGDLVAADVALTRALRSAQGAEARAEVMAGLAEVRYAQGKHDEAQARADEALALAPDRPMGLAARNTLGKLLLARGEWASAEAHFAADAQLASQLGDDSAHLRARLNRAIAVMSDGRSHEAKPMLEAVLSEGERQGDERAEAFSLSNLAVLAINRHDYGEALQLSEQAIAVRRRMGERLGLARVITNLAELRLRLGLIDEAEQALAFGRVTLSRGTTAPRTAHFALIAARIALARGNTLGASRELATALAGASGSSDGDMLCECHRLAIRVALEEGDVERARQEIDLAEGYPLTPSAGAEVALLRARTSQASGRPSLDEALQAVALSRRAGDEEFLREAHTLTAQLALADGQPELARSHLHQALALRDHVLGGLPERLRRSFAGRRDLQALPHLERELSQAIQPPSQPPQSLSDPPRSASRPRLPTRTLTGEDPAIRGLHDGIRKVARTDATVLVLGESGTGKELVAEAIHDLSARRDAPLVKVNCAALVESLLLSELFGHEKGSFTGAHARKRGRFEMAEGGTLFLDEIGDISPATQVALLRVLQERTYERVGGTTPLRANVRIVAATHRDLKQMVERGEFRRDLYFRLSGLSLHLPPLRARLGDLPLLARHLLQRIADERGEAPRAISAEALSVLARHRWPGNVRELENALRAASVFAEGDAIEAPDLTQHVEALRSPEPRRAEPAPPEAPEADEPEAEGDGPVVSLDGASSDATSTAYAELKAGKFGLFDLKRQLERDCIARALAETRGNITRAATILGMKRPRLSQLVKQYGLAAISSEGS